MEKYKIASDGIQAEVMIDTSLNKGYFIKIPELPPATNALMENIKRELIARVNVTFSEILDPKEINNLKSKFVANANEILKNKVREIDEDTRSVIIGRLVQETLGLGLVEFLLNDGNIEEVVINSSSEPIRVYHKVYGWLETNVRVSSEAQILNYSNIIARRAGRQVSTLNPLLDAHLVTGDRANAVLYPISTKGNTVTIRKFSRDPWTVVDLIKNGTGNAEIFSLIWLAMEYELNIIVSGATASGKTSFLNAITPFIPPNQRVVSIEDSVHGNSKIVYKENDKFNITTIGKLIDSKIKENSETLLDGNEIHRNKDIQIFSMNNQGKLELVTPSSLIRHKVKKDLYEITLSSGKKIKVTGDHSLFSIMDNNITPIKCSGLKKGNFIASPRHINFSGKDVIFHLDHYLDRFSKFQLEGEGIGEMLKKMKKQLNKVRSKSQIRHYIKFNRIPISVFRSLKLKIPNSIKNKIKIIPIRSTKNGRVGIPLVFEIDNYMACLIGLWLADGSYDKLSTIFSVVDENCNKIVNIIAERLRTKPRLHSDGLSLMINSSAFKTFLKHVLNLEGNAYTKKIPEWVFNLKEENLLWLLRGYISGDGSPCKNELTANSCSLELLKGLQTLFLRFGIIFRINFSIRRDKTYMGTISGAKFLRAFYYLGGFLQEYQNKKLISSIKEKSHDVSDIIPLSYNSYLPLKHILGNNFKRSRPYTSWKSWHGWYKHSNIGRSQLQSILTKFLPIGSLSKTKGLLEEIKLLAFNDIFWDRVINIKKERFRGYVYDMSVPKNENFICENIICHNTQEILLPSYLYWSPLVARESNQEGKGAVNMLDLMVNSLRMRPDRIIVGEIRTKDQARVLFEAMHTGHSVYSTLHANTSQETIQRLTNQPINVPRNLMEAVNLNIVMFRDRRKGIRRVSQISEFIVNYEKDDVSVKPNLLYIWKAGNDKIEPKNKGDKLFEEIIRHTGMTEAEIKNNLKEKENFLNKLVKNNTRDINSFGNAIKDYYSGKK